MYVCKLRGFGFAHAEREIPMESALSDRQAIGPAMPVEWSKRRAWRFRKGSPKRLAYHLERLLPASQLPKLPQGQPRGLRIGLARRFSNDAFVVHH
jgi:hypothetical protein